MPTRWFRCATPRSSRPGCRTHDSRCGRHPVISGRWRTSAKSWMPCAPERTATSALPIGFVCGSRARSSQSGSEQRVRRARSPPCSAAGHCARSRRSRSTNARSPTTNLPLRPATRRRVKWIATTRRAAGRAGEAVRPLVDIDARPRTVTSRGWTRSSPHSGQSTTALTHESRSRRFSFVPRRNAGPIRATRRLVRRTTGTVSPSEHSDSQTRGNPRGMCDCEVRACARHSHRSSRTIVHPSSSNAHFREDSGM